MSKDHEREKLIADLFHDEWAAGPAGEFARRAAAHARRRQAVRRAVRTVAATSGLAAAVAIVLTQRPEKAPDMNPPSISRPAYEIISDDELIAQLPDRPLLVEHGPRGEKRITLLGR